MDAWLSPWADEIQIKHPVNEPDKRPVTPAEASELSSEEKQYTISPWDDGEDESAKGWGSIPVEDRRGARFDGADEEWAVDTIRNGAMTSMNSLTSIQQGDDQSLYLNLSSVHAEVVQKTADDPWRGEITFTNNSSSLTNSKDTEGRHFQSPINLVDDVVPTTLTPQSIIFHGGNPILSGDGELEEIGYLPKKSSESLQFQGSKPILEVEPTVSRPSSSLSEQSQHDELPQESPRTSIDDEPKRLQICTPAPVVTQEIVEHKINGQILNSQERNVDLECSGEDLEDFGDFEEQSGIEESSDPDFIKGVKTRLPEGLESIEFNIDSSMFDKIYLDLPVNASKEELFIPDTVPYDSFSSTNQRKLWYRLSRYGSKRKHDSGDDERYARVNWNHSKVREETLKTVKRWMEEDRINGRVVLGGSHKGSSIFGWNDPKSSPLPLSQAFLERRPRNRTEQQNIDSNISSDWPKSSIRDGSTLNLRSPPEVSREESLKSTFIANESVVFAEPSVANFQWSSGLEETQISTNRLAGVLPTVIPENMIVTKQPAFPSLTDIDAGATKNLQPAQFPPVVLPLSIDGEINPLPPVSAPSPLSDDDSWGEMVSSPSSIPPPFSPTHRLLHQKSQSFGGKCTPLTQTSSTQATDLQFSRSSLSIKRAGEDLISQIEPRKGSGSAASFTRLPAAQVSYISKIPNSTDGIINRDPWALADFSFFEQGTTPRSQAAILSIPSELVNLGNTKTRVTLLQNQRSKEEIEQDRIVQSVVQILPDLSYMLKK